MPQYRLTRRGVTFVTLAVGLVFLIALGVAGGVEVGLIPIPIGLAVGCVLAIATLFIARLTR